MSMIAMPNTERTEPQVLVVPLYDGRLPKSKQNTSAFYKKVREMRRDPTIALARWLSIAPVLASQWSIEAEDGVLPEIKDKIHKEVMPLRMHFLTHAFFGCVDWGWQTFEKVFEVDEQGYVCLKKLKPLLPDFTEIVVDERTGAFLGVAQQARADRVEDTLLTLPECLLVNIDVEGTDWYGQSMMAVVEGPYDQWNVVNCGADRYDKKVAGSHWVVKYPRGTTKVNGVVKDNFEVARMLLNQLESSGGIAVPKTISDVVDDLNKDSPDAWTIELINDSGGHVYYIDRMKYIDALKVRAFGWPERAVLEGTFGTKAEAESHADLGILLTESRHSKMVQQLNWHLVNQLIRLNHGPEYENRVYIQQAPIADLERQYLRDIYKAILADPNSFLEEQMHIDMEAMRDRLGVPTKFAQDWDPTLLGDPNLYAPPLDEGLPDILPAEELVA